MERESLLGAMVYDTKSGRTGCVFGELNWLFGWRELKVSDAGGIFEAEAEDCRVIDDDDREQFSSHHSPPPGGPKIGSLPPHLDRSPYLSDRFRAEQITDHNHRFPPPPMLNRLEEPIETSGTERGPTGAGGSPFQAAGPAPVRSDELAAQPRLPSPAPATTAQVPPAVSGDPAGVFHGVEPTKTRRKTGVSARKPPQKPAKNAGKTGVKPGKSAGKPAQNRGKMRA